MRAFAVELRGSALTRCGAGLNDTGRNAEAPRSAWDRFWYDFYFKAPEKSAWEKQLQAREQ